MTEFFIRKSRLIDGNIHFQRQVHAAGIKAINETTKRAAAVKAAGKKRCVVRR